MIEIIEDNKIPDEIMEFKIQHYKDVFSLDYESILNTNVNLPKTQKILILKEDGRVAGSCTIIKSIYDVKFKDFSILPFARGKGYAKILMGKLEEVAIEHHNSLIESGLKPKDIQLMYIRSLIYLNSDDLTDTLHALEFGKYLKSIGFNPCAPNAYEYLKDEFKAAELYKKLYPTYNFKVFKKLVYNNGIELSDKIKTELDILKSNKDKYDIVLNGLNWKLGHYSKSGEVSFKYNICPICKDMDTDIPSILSVGEHPCPTEGCYIYNACMEPFRSVGFFKENNEVSGAYFQAMKDYLIK